MCDYHQLIVLIGLTTICFAQELQPVLLVHDRNVLNPAFKEAPLLVPIKQNSFKRILEQISVRGNQSSTILIESQWGVEDMIESHQNKYLDEICSERECTFLPQVEEPMNILTSASTLSLTPEFSDASLNETLTKLESYILSNPHDSNIILVGSENFKRPKRTAEGIVEVTDYPKDKYRVPFHSMYANNSTMKMIVGSVQITSRGRSNAEVQFKSVRSREAYPRGRYNLSDPVTGNRVSIVASLNSNSSWVVESIYLNGRKLYPENKIKAPIGKSFYCQRPLTFMSDNEGGGRYIMVIRTIQIQFGRNVRSDNPFGPIITCPPEQEASPGETEAYFLSVVLAVFLMNIVFMLGSVKSNDRFENPDGPPLPINLIN